MRRKNASSAPRTILVASLVGTTIELFDFYIYATAAVLVFPHLFFPASNPAVSRLASLATFGIAFLARPVGSVIFGHFGDRIGRRTTLVFALAAMGVSTFAIGLLPGYDSIGPAAPILLMLCRFGQGLGLGGEWGGALLLAVENAPPHKRAWYGMFPQLGAPAGFFLSGGFFLLLSRWLTEQQFLSVGWRVPFLGSSVLVLLGLYVRLKLMDTPVFLKIRDRRQPLRLPALEVLRNHKRSLLNGVLMGLSTFVLFYLMTVFALSWGTGVLGYGREPFLRLQLLATLCFALAIPIGAILAERGRRRWMVAVTVAIGLFGLVVTRLLSSSTMGALAMIVGMSLLGFTYGPLGTLTSELFPTLVRYTGSSLAFSFAAILGASLAPFTTNWLALTYGLNFVGYYLTAAATVTIVGLMAIPKTEEIDFEGVE